MMTRTSPWASTMFTPAGNLGARPICFVFGFLAVFGNLVPSASAADHVPNYELPADHRTEVIVLDFIAPHEKSPNINEPKLSIAADGTVRVQSRFADQPSIVGRLTERQLNELLHTIIVDQHFLDQQSDQLASTIAVERELRGQASQVRGADKTFIQLTLKDKTHAVYCDALGVAVNQAADSAWVQRMYATQRSLENIMAIIEAGGGTRAKQMLDQANQALLAEHGKVTPFTLSELTSTQRMPNGGYYVQFSRIPQADLNSPADPTVLIVSVFDAPGAKPHVNVTASLPPVSASNRPVLR